MLQPSATLEPPPAPWSRARLGLAAAGLLALNLFFACYHLSDLPLLDPDEPRYAAAGRTMAQGGSWLVPQFNGEPRLNKPPLFYWLVALSDLAFGEASEASARAPSILMGILMVALTVLVGVRLFGAATGFLAGLILVTSPLYLAIHRTCIIDQTFSTLLTASLACLLLGLSGDWPWPRFKAALAVGLFAGLAFLAKGTAALLAFLIPLVFAACFCRGSRLRCDPRHWLRVWSCCGGAWAWAGSALLMTGLSLWWYLALTTGGTINLEQLLRKEVLGRLSGEMHQELPIYYLYVLPALAFPWSIGLIAAWGSACKQIECPPAEAPARWPDAAQRAKAADTFLAAWLLTVVLFFSIPGAKLGTYVLPAFPAFALLTARLLARLSHSRPAAPLARSWKMATLTLILLLTEVLLVLARNPLEQLPGAERVPVPILKYLSLAALVLFLLLAAFLAARLLIGPPLREERRDGERSDPAAPGDPAGPSQEAPRPSPTQVLAAFALPFLAAMACAECAIPTRLIELPNRWMNLVESYSAPLWTFSLLLFLFTCLPWILVCLTRQALKAALLQATFVTLVTAVLLPMKLPELERRSNRRLCQRPGIEAQVQRATHVYSVGCEEESLVYYLDRPVRELRHPDRNLGETHGQVLAEVLRKALPNRIVLFVHYRYFQKFLRNKPPPGCQVLDRNEHIVVLANDPGA